MAFIVTFRNNNKEFYLKTRRSDLRQWTSNRQEALVFHYTDVQIKEYIRTHFQLNDSVHYIYTGRKTPGVNTRR